MKTPLRWILMIVAIVAVGFGGYWYGRSHAPRGDAAAEPDASTTQPAEEKTPVVSVQTVPIRRDTLRQTLVAYGPVTAQASDVAVVSVPFEARVGRVLVTPGEEVTAGAVLGDIGPSPDTQLQIRQAKAAVAAAKKDLAQTQQRFADHLSTNSDLLTSQQNTDAAQLKLDAFDISGAASSQQLKASAAGIISKIDVQDGQIVPAGGPLVEIAAGSRIVARLGIEPENATAMRKGDPVTLTEVRTGAATTVAGTVDLVTKRVNTDTRLVDLFVSLPKDSGLILEGYVRGELTAASAQGLVVPRSAVLPDEDEYTLFTVRDGKAVKHKVTIGLQNDQDVLITGEDLHAGDPVVVVGNYELEDGMAVTVDATTQPASEPASEPATEPASQPSTIAAEAKP